MELSVSLQKEGHVHNSSILRKLIQIFELLYSLAISRSEDIETVLYSESFMDSENPQESQFQF